VAVEEPVGTVEIVMLVEEPVGATLDFLLPCVTHAQALDIRPWDPPHFAMKSDSAAEMSPVCDELQNIPTWASPTLKSALRQLSWLHERCC
jgi:hypothetical protein